MLTEKQEAREEFFKLLRAAMLPAMFLFFMLLIKITEVGLDTTFHRMGVFPLKAFGLIGILTSPLVHGDWAHLYSNSMPWMVLGTMFMYFHKRHAVEIFMALYLISGAWLWLIGHPVYHIGASGVIYALAAFHVTYGFVIRNPQMLAISFLVILFYGAMIWYVLPVKEGMSWEGHLCGALTGVVLAIYYGKNYKKTLLEVSGSMNFSHNTQFGDQVEFNYFYKEKEGK